MNYKLNLLCQAWNKDSNVLFDYDTNDYTISNLEVMKPGDLIQVEKKVEYRTTYTKPTDHYITSIDIKGDDFTIKLNEKKEISPIDERMWVVIRNIATKGDLGYQLREGDLIKFGKVMFKIKEISINSNKQADLDNNTLHNKANEANNELEKSSKLKKGVLPACRICLMDDNTNDNPLISPCTCIGSVRFVHLLCLRQWHKSKMNIKTFNVLVVHSFKMFECEICKTPIPEKIKFKSKVLSLIDFQRPQSDYLILESISREGRENKYMYLIKLGENKLIKLGRANDADVRMTDISVSRNHATIQLKNGRVYLEDNWSKFGSLVQMQNDVALIPHKQISIQCGKFHFLFNLTKTCYAWLRCYISKSLNFQDYNEMFHNQAMVFYQRELNTLNAINSDYTPSVGDSISLNKKFKLKQKTQEDDQDESEENGVVDSSSKYAIDNLKGDNSSIRYERNEDKDEDNNIQEEDDALRRYSIKLKEISQLVKANTPKGNSSRDNLIEVHKSNKEVNVTNQEYTGCETSYQPLIKNEYQNNNSQTMNVTGNTISRPISAIDHLNKEPPLVRNYNSNKDRSNKEVINSTKHFVPKSTKNKDNLNIHDKGYDKVETVSDSNEEKLLINKFNTIKPDEEQNIPLIKGDSLLRSKTFLNGQKDDLSKFELITIRPRVNLKLSDDEILSEDFRSENNQIGNAVDNLFNDLSHINNIGPNVSSINCNNNLIDHEFEESSIPFPKHRKSSNPEIKIPKDDTIDIRPQYDT